jgi:DNA-directed RNA polymerase subunit RPC12/RpoP
MAMTRNYCLECGGDLSYDSVLKQYTCRSCGMTFTAQELMEGREKLFETRDSSEEERKRRQKDYLKWWLSKK